jgi:hypothetical protein
MRYSFLHSAVGRRRSNLTFRDRLGGVPPVVMLMLLALSCVLQVAAPAQLVLANGGTIQVSSAQVGPYQVTVLTSPSPMVAGTVDVTVAVSDPRVTDPSKDNTVLDAQVTVIVQQAGGSSAPASFPATHEQATNKLLYQANVSVPSGGQWQFSVQVAGPDGGGTVQFSSDVGSSLFGLDPVQFSLMAFAVLGIIITGVVVLIRDRRLKAGQIATSSVPTTTAGATTDGDASQQDSASQEHEP